MFNTTNFYKAYKSATYKVSLIRENLHGVYVEYTDDALVFVGTDAQVMYIAKQPITNTEEQEKYKELFAPGKLLTPVNDYKPKSTTGNGTVEKQGDFFIIDGIHYFKEADVCYPNYTAIIPSGTGEASEYTCFTPHNIAKADYVMGYKKHLTIIGTIPMQESCMSPAVWKFISREYTETLIVMPMNVKYLNHQEGATQK